MGQQHRSGHRLQVVAPERRLAGVASRSRVYEGVLRELGRRVDRVHRVLRERGDVLPESLPSDRDLSSWEVEELAWRVYVLACLNRWPLVHCHPALVFMAAEWLSSTEPWVWEAFCELHLS